MAQPASALAAPNPVPALKSCVGTGEGGGLVCEGSGGIKGVDEMDHLFMAAHRKGNGGIQ